MIKKQITQQIEEVLKELGVHDVSPQVDYPADAKFGDYSTNVALVAAKKVGKNPRELAEELRKELGIRNQESGLFEKVEIAGPGFVNFWVRDEVLVENVTRPSTALRQESPFAGKKIMVEYTDPNPFKELHIGHLYSNIIGESLCKIFEAAGAEVCRVDYFGDVGMHVAKSIWGLEQKLNQADSQYTSMEELAAAPLVERIKFLGEGYALGANKYAEDTEAAEVIRMINKHIYIAAQHMWQEEKGLEPVIDYQQGQTIHKETLEHIKEIYILGRKWSLEYFETLYKRLGTTFDKYYPESIAGEWGYKVVKEHIPGVFVKSEGAIIFPGEKFGLHNRVFINKLGLPTYEAKELGLMPWKFSEFAYDYSFIVTATEIAGYFSVLKEAMTQVNKELGDKTTPVLHGMVKLPEGKMSSRSGNVITVTSILDEAKNLVLPRVSKDIDDSDAVAEMVGMGAVKYAFLKSAIGKDIIFDFEASVNFDGNSGPYLQYTFARTQSVLNKAGENRGPHPDPLLKGEGKLVPEERELLRLLVRFDEVVEEAAVRYAPSAVATYLFELAQAYNLFYQKHQILKAEEQEKEFRLALTAKTGEVLKQGLDLLGIQAPERM